MWKLESFTTDNKHHINKTNRKQLDRQIDRQTDPCDDDLYLILATFVLYKQF